MTTEPLTLTRPSTEELYKFLGTKLNRNLAMYFQSCQRCGACAENCHYYKATGDPKMIPAYKAELVRRLYKRQQGSFLNILPWFGSRDGELSDDELQLLVDSVFGRCTMCRRCTINCPMGIDIAMIMRACRGMLTLAHLAPKGLQATVDKHLQTGNNMGVSSQEFVETVKWMEEELQKDVGDPNCTIPIDKPGAKNLWVLNPREVMFFPLLLKAQAKIFYAAGEDYTLSSRSWDVTNYALFNGDDVAARTIAGYVLSEADRLGIKKILCTECGHGMRQLKQMAPIWLKRNDFQVRAFVEVVADYIRRERIKLDPKVNQERVTYHDPCNQGRSAGYIEEPRYVLRHSVMDYVDLLPSGRDNWCCGGGGGALTMSEFRSRRLDAAKVKADQLKASGAKIVATSCHNCIDQLNEINRHYNLGMKVVNTCELTADALVLARPKDDHDGEGYLKDPSIWNWDMAQIIAIRERVGDLTEDHRRIIEYVRNYYDTHKDWPLPARIGKDLDVKRSGLFNRSPEVLFKVAGLPNPGDHITWDVRGLKDCGEK
ncbi:MAG: TusE/DsrC/DsvC family sulfur relay protein [Dehalococcoidia bacterium]